ncbi:MAG TPA: sialidase family protein, partial [Thermoanaerobaculia bacterium]|nr:sialidase family protein [Thermoanaerobaculia bacterium]
TLRGQEVPMSAPDQSDPNKGNNTTQSETNHAVTANGVIGAWNDSSQLALMGTMAKRISWRGSSNGVTFSGGGFFNTPDGCKGDPAVVADSQGFFYMATITDFSAIGVARTTGTMPPFSFNAGIVMDDGFATLDKELMAIDRTNGANKNRIYLVASNVPKGVIEAHTTSLNPLKFSAFQKLPGSDGVLGAMPAVAPNGDVFVVWPHSLFYEIVKSSDGGVSYTNPDPNDGADAKRIAQVTPSPDGLPNAGLKTKSFPQIAIDSTAAGSPTRGNIYVVFHADPDDFGSGDLADIFFTRSIDGGKKWSEPRSISSGPAATIGRDKTKNDNWMPSIAVSPVNGHIYVTFVDRREDTTANDGDPVGMKARIYRALSTDAGQTWNVAPLGSTAFTPIAGFEVGQSSYWGEYNWATANANGLQFSWGDSRNLCAPPMNAANPCSPAGRPDQDTFYRTVANLSGPDLFIKPWGKITGEPPNYQTSYIYVVDDNEVKINAQKGIINHLRARVRNLGNAAGNSATIHFKFSPAYAGFDESVMKEIGTMSVSFSAAGGATDDQILKIDWDLTDVNDTNGGKWPNPVSFYDHFCVLVRIDLGNDVNLSNNVAQNNFFNVKTASMAMKFMVDGAPGLARIAVSKLPPGFHAQVTVDGVANPTRGFRLKPGEIRNAQATFTGPDCRSATDVVTDITLLLNDVAVGGISVRLCELREPREPADVIGATTAPFWEVLPEDETLQIRGEEIPQPPEPPKRTIPRAVKYRQTYRASYDKVYAAILKMNPGFADFDRGLINTRHVHAHGASITRLIEERDRIFVTHDGYSWMSLWLEPHGDVTEVGVDAWIGIEELYTPEGRRLHSNGTLERATLNAIKP